jgi:hypothetical protein
VARRAPFASKLLELLALAALCSDASVLSRIRESVALPSFVLPTGRAEFSPAEGCPTT